ncbi:MAG: hypothetical protein WCI09_04855, partial [Planctomycetota bacterium]
KLEIIGAPLTFTAVYMPVALAVVAWNLLNKPDIPLGPAGRWQAHGVLQPDFAKSGNDSAASRNQRLYGKEICRELEITEPGKQKKSDQGEQSDAADSR